MSNDLTIQNSNNTGVVAGDVLIPRLLLQQGMSDFVKERKAQMGDMVRSTDAQKLGDPETKMEFIPLSQPIGTWIESYKPEGFTKFKYKRRIARTAANDRSRFDYYVSTDPATGVETEYDTPVANSVPHKRVKCLSLYILLPQDIAAFELEKKKAMEGGIPDVSKALAPLMVEFRSTSFNAGKELTTFYTQTLQFGAKPYQYVLKLGCSLESNGDNSFYVYNVDRSKITTVSPAYMAQVEYWANIVRNPNSLKIDDSVDSTEPSTSSDNIPF